MRIGILGFAVVLCVLPSSGQGQEIDNGVFHYSQLELDAFDAEGRINGTWLAEGWIGTDFDRLWWETDGERFDGAIEEAEVTLLYGRYVRRFWDAVIGYRHELEPISQGYLTVGMMGLAPYWFEVGLFAAVSDNGRPSLRLEAETDLFITQRWILQPLAHLDVLLARDDDLGLDAGFRTAELGVRTRYEIRRKFAPYVDLRWIREEEPPGSELHADRSGARLSFGVRLVH